MCQIASLSCRSLMKQACVKTLIMASAADRCLRVIVTASSGGLPRILPIFFEAAANKNAMVATRRNATEYICLAAALWPNEVLEKNLSAFKSAIKSGTSDAGISCLYVYCIEMLNIFILNQKFTLI